MKEITYSGLRNEEKAEWGEGPWMDEPDKMQWEDKATGLPCLVVRNHWGGWCGYVGVAEDHPAYGLGYDEMYQRFPDVGVHGGLTFAGHCVEGPEDRSICHIPEPGEPDNVWWQGFDCGHFMDIQPRMLAHERKLYEETGDPIWLMGSERSNEGEFRATYKDLSYVRAETTRLAGQLGELEFSRTQRAWRWLRNA